ncbi:hypothetical protein EUGRSUZ_A01978 [Eucalyptus grandis]|uniref:Uncharacterized protein n=2 Tax=Eucalyptus grandis TaxID=71139 RepID=A0ACC3M5R9_EUCGR|nr:hypothetical protein EUGRSUZ_A01978 [Eucalyptus grandis]
MVFSASSYQIREIGELVHGFGHLKKKKNKERERKNSSGAITREMKGKLGTKRLKRLEAPVFFLSSILFGFWFFYSGKISYFTSKG